MENHVKVTGWLNILHSALLMLFFLMPIFAGSAFVDWYWRFFSMPVLEPREEFIHAVASFYQKAGLVFIVIFLVYFCAGIGLLKLKSWARLTTLVFNFLLLGHCHLDYLSEAIPSGCFSRKRRRVFLRECHWAMFQVRADQA